MWVLKQREPLMEVEELIQSVVKMLGIDGVTEEYINYNLISKGCNEYDVFLIIKAGQNLYNAIIEQEKEIKARKPPFGRK